jgi:glycosyltransferase involved in cell wall biosynthesis
MHEERGHFDQAVTAWYEQARSIDVSLEIIAVTTRPIAAARIRRRWPLLRVYCQPGANLSQQYDIAAQAAQGSILIFTEAHCRPRPDFLQQLTQLWCDDPRCAGITARIVPICHNRIAEMDALLWSEGFEQLVPPLGAWRRFNIQGTALRHDVYRQLGGLPHRYNRFAEMIFNARLRDSGFYIAYSDKLVIDHIFRTDLRSYLSDIKSYVCGENLYRQEAPQVDPVNHTFVFPLPPDAHKEDLLWEIFYTLTTDLLRRGLWQRDGLSWRLWCFAWQLWCTGGRRLLWRYRWQAGSAVWRCWWWRWWSRRRLEQAYRQLWPAWSRYYRLQHLLRHSPLAGATPASGLPCSVLAWPSEQQLGFYRAEQHQGRTFCWSGPLMALRLPPCQRERRVRLGLLGSPGNVDPTTIRAYFCGRLLPETAVGSAPAELSWRLPATPHSSCLIVGRLPLVPRLHGQADERLLGLPVQSITIAELGSTMSQQQPRAA